MAIIDMPANIAPPNPYVGPRPFRRNELFYGRGREVTALVNTLVSARIVLLHSPSGAGKTSLIQAGVVPAFEKDRFQICARWRGDFSALRVNRPVPKGLTVDNRYVFSVVTAMIGHLRSATKLGHCTIAQALDMLAEQPDRKQRQLIVIDQFEELLTLDPTDQDGQCTFFEQLGEALNSRNRWALLAMREDYMGGLDSFVHHIPGKLRSTYRLAPLELDNALEAIKAPAEERGVAFQDDAAKSIVEDLRLIRIEVPEVGIMPRKGHYVEPVLLQVVCDELWRTLSDQQRSNFKTVSSDDVGKFGPLNMALARYYQHAVQRAAGADRTVERAVRDWIDRKLITQQYFRGQTRSMPDVSDKEGVLSRLEERYLIRAEPRVGGIWWELSHDRLIEPIITANETWRRENLEFWQVAADQWRRSGRKREFLLTGAAYQLARYQSPKAGRLFDFEQEFLEESRNADNAERDLQNAQGALHKLGAQAERLRAQTIFLRHGMLVSLLTNTVLVLFIVFILFIR